MKSLRFTAVCAACVTVALSALVNDVSRAGSATATKVVKNLAVVEVGVRLSNDQQTLYLRVDRDIRPAACPESSLLKLNLDNPARTLANELATKILIAAKAGNRKITLVVPEERCLYGNPTFDVVYLTD